MRICKRLWEANISAEFMPQENPNLGKQLQFALEKRIPYMVIFGDTELEQNMVKVHGMQSCVQA
jgi:histidyl-tRNA synthetase